MFDDALSADHALRMSLCQFIPVVLLAGEYIAAEYPES